MSHLVPDWNMEEDSTIFSNGLCTSLQKKSPGLDSELVELFWENGHVVMHSQTHRKPSATAGELGQAHTSGLAPKCKGAPDNSSNPIQDDTAAWFEYPLEDSLERELCSGFFNEMPTADTIRSDKLNKDVSLDERFVKFGAAEQSNVFMGSASQHSSLSFQESTMLPSNLHTENVFRNSNSCFKGGAMPPPKSLVTGSTPSLVDGGVFMSNFLRPVKADFGSTRESLGKNGSQNGVPVEVGESSSMRSIGSSMCGSNQVHNWAEVSQNLSDDVTGVLAKGFKKDAQLPHERVRTDIFEATMTSSSGLSGSSFGRTGQQSTSNQGHKRKGRDGEESECHSEDAENESIDANKPVQRSASTRRTRAAEVHNLSERRRRDRINEKMKALQELIPHCNKSDKASMLDEAIEYLKSLQLQIQIMWMGSGMVQLMFPGIQQYLSRMGMGMGHSPIPPIHGPVQLPGAPLVNQSIPTALGTNQTPMCPSPSLNPANFPNQMQNAHFPESYAQYLRLHHMQPPPQTMNLYTYGSHMAQQNQSAVAARSSGLSTNTGGPYENMKGEANAR